MSISQSEELLVSVRLMQDDAESIFSLLNTERNSVVSMGIIPYYSLFAQSCQDFLGEKFFPDYEAQKIKNMRNRIKTYADGFGKTKKKLLETDSRQDDEFKSMLRFDFMKKWNIHYNLGTYWTDDKHIVGNTQQIYDFFEIQDLNDPDKGKNLREIAYQISSFICSIRQGLLEYWEPSTINRKEKAVTVNYYCDINTNRCNSLFVDSSNKELNLFFLDLLCNMNFIKHIVRNFFEDNNSWVFRVEYIVTYYTLRALERMKNYCENNSDVTADTEGIDEILRQGAPLFQSKFRNCMMHYNLVDKEVLSVEYIDKPLYGLIETCFGGIDYSTYLDSLRMLADKIVTYIESRFDFSSIKLTQL